jgi:hypothetical protein
VADKLDCFCRPSLMWFLIDLFSCLGPCDPCAMLKICFNLTSHLHFLLYLEYSCICRCVTIGGGSAIFRDN